MDLLSVPGTLHPLHLYIGYFFYQENLSLLPCTNSYGSFQSQVLCHFLQEVLPDPTSGSGYMPSFMLSEHLMLPLYVALITLVASAPGLPTHPTRL